MRALRLSCAQQFLCCIRRVCKLVCLACVCVCAFFCVFFCSSRVRQNIRVAEQMCEALTFKSRMDYYAYKCMPFQKGAG